MKNVVDLSSQNYAVVDKETGTVLGTNVCLVPWPTDKALAEEILSSDSAAWEYAEEFGIPLLVE